MAIRTTFELKVGATLAFELIDLVGSDRNPVGSLTGWTATSMVRSNPTDAAPLISMTGVANGVRFLFSGSTASLSAGLYYGEVKVVDPAGFIAFSGDYMLRMSLPNTHP